MYRLLQTLSFSLILTTLLGACLPPVFPGQSTPLPLPTELAPSPLPAEAQQGTLDSPFASLASTPGAGNERCYKLFRFYPDGLVVYTHFACFEQPPGIKTWQEIYAWFNRENENLDRGDYFTAGDRIWIRIVQFDPVNERVALRAYQGQYCDNDMVLQQPAVSGYSGIPSAITQPVLEYANIRPLAPRTGQTCQITRFTVLARPSVALTGNDIQFEVQTRPSESCNLEYTPPALESKPDPIKVMATADDQGVCRWQWAAGDQPGKAVITMTIGAITQQFAIEIR